MVNLMPTITILCSLILLDTRHKEASFYFIVVYGCISILLRCVSVEGWAPNRRRTTKLRLMIVGNFKNNLFHCHAIFSVEIHSLVTFIFSSGLLQT